MHRPLVAAVALAFVAAMAAAQQPPSPKGSGAKAGAVLPGDKDTRPPRLLKEAKPQYTLDAMRARIEGTVVVECVVETDGTVREVTVLKSLDKEHGLDDEAVKAARRWRFKPAMKKGKPIAVAVTLELTFTLREAPPKK